MKIDYRCEKCGTISKTLQEGLMHEATCIGDPKALARMLHETECFKNHTDECGWFYEITKGRHNWKKITHRMYLEKALAFIAQAKEERCESKQTE